MGLSRRKMLKKAAAAGGVAFVPQVVTGAISCAIAAGRPVLAPGNQVSEGRVS